MTIVTGSILFTLFDHLPPTICRKPSSRNAKLDHSPTKQHYSTAVGSTSASSSRVNSAVGSIVAGEDIDIGFLNENYMSVVDKDQDAPDISYRKVGYID